MNQAQLKVKIVVVGPSEAGKTSVTNLLGNENIVDSTAVKLPYHPTHSVRIVDFTTKVNDSRKSLDVEVQLWEVGGSGHLKSIWPGVQKDADGILIVYNPSSEQDIKDASALHMHFVTHSSGISPAQCFIIGNNFRGMREREPQKILGVGQKVRHITLNVEDDVNYLREEFHNFVTGVASIVHERQKANFAGLK